MDHIKLIKVPDRWVRWFAIPKHDTIVDGVGKLIHPDGEKVDILTKCYPNQTMHITIVSSVKGQYAFTIHHTVLQKMKERGDKVDVVNIVECMMGNFLGFDRVYAYKKRYTTF